MSKETFPAGDRKALRGFKGREKEGWQGTLREAQVRRQATEGVRRSYVGVCEVKLFSIFPQKFLVKSAHSLTFCGVDSGRNMEKILSPVSGLILDKRAGAPGAPLVKHLSWI